VRWLATALDFVSLAILDAVQKQRGLVAPRQEEAAAERQRHNLLFLRNRRLAVPADIFAKK
jgi:hypothetical protein